MFHGSPGTGVIRNDFNPLWMAFCNCRSLSINDDAVPDAIKETPWHPPTSPIILSRTVSATREGQIDCSEALGRGHSPPKGRVEGWGST